MSHFSWLLILSAAAPAAFAQGVVEYGLGAARASTTAAPAAAAGKSIAGAFDKLSKALETAGKPQPSDAKTTTTTVVRLAPESPAKPPAKPVAVAGLKAGMPYDDLVKSYGSPSLELTGEGGEKTAWYESKEQSVELLVRDGKLASWRVKPKQAQAAALTITQ